VNESLPQLYSSKTVDDLLVLAIDEQSLLEEARQVLLLELQRRGIDAATIANAVKDRRISPSRGPFSRSLKFSCVLILNVFVAVLGTAALEEEIGSVIPSALNRRSPLEMLESGFILRGSGRLPRVEKMECTIVKVDLDHSGRLGRLEIYLGSNIA
jgi:hypothetical protein